MLARELLDIQETCHPQPLGDIKELLNKKTELADMYERMKKSFVAVTANNTDANADHQLPDENNHIADADL